MPAEPSCGCCGVGIGSGTGTEPCNCSRCRHPVDQEEIEELLRSLIDKSNRRDGRGIGLVEKRLDEVHLPEEEAHLLNMSQRGAVEVTPPALTNFCLLPSSHNLTFNSLRTDYGNSYPDTNQF